MLKGTYLDSLFLWPYFCGSDCDVKLFFLMFTMQFSVYILTLILNKQFTFHISHVCLAVLVLGVLALIISSSVG